MTTLVNSSHLIFLSMSTPTTATYSLSLHDALPIFHAEGRHGDRRRLNRRLIAFCGDRHLGTLSVDGSDRSEEHTSELQSLRHLVCRLLLEKKKREKHIYQKNCTLSMVSLNEIEATK